MTPRTPQTISDLFPDRWLRPDDLNGRSFTITIRAVIFEELHNPRTNRKELKAIVDFGRTKQLPLNKTQAHAIADIAGSETFSDWPGTAVTLKAGLAHNNKETIHITPAKAPKQKPPAAQPVPIAENDDTAPESADIANNDDAAASPQMTMGAPIATNDDAPLFSYTYQDNTEASDEPEERIAFDSYRRAHNEEAPPSRAALSAWADSLKK